MPIVFRRLHIAFACLLATAATAYPARVAAAPYPPGAPGADISWPQCGGPLPGRGEVAVVGVNDGHPYSVNPCFAQEWQWARPSESASVYINLDRSAGDVAAHGGSSYADGWSAAAFSASVVSAQGARPTMWWLDVETTGDWSCGATACDTGADAAVVRGAIDFLNSKRLPVGIYSNTTQWAIIAGGYAPGVPVWTTDYDDPHPWSHCGANDAFGGGHVALVQLFPTAYDTDYVCATPPGLAMRAERIAGGYVLDGDGTLHPVNGAPAVTNRASWPNWDIARGAAVCPTDPQSGYLADGWGGVHPFGAPGHVPPDVLLTGYWPGWDIVRGIVVLPDCRSGYVLEGWGGIHPFGASGDIPPDVLLSAYWSGWDIARDIVLNPADPRGGYVLEGWGGIHPFGQSGHLPPALNISGYWPGWDIARAMALAPDGETGYVVEGWGGVHPISSGNLPVSPSITGYSDGQDTFRGIAMAPGSASEAYTVDTSGHVWPVKGLPTPPTPGLTPATPATLSGRLGVPIG